MLSKSENVKWTPQLVAEYFEEAVSTTRKLPPVKAQGYFSVWPDIMRTPNELMMQKPRPMRLYPTPGAISRLEQTFEWIPWLEIEERKLIWKRATRVAWKIICRGLGCGRTTAWCKWMSALRKISSRLNKLQVKPHKELSRVQEQGRYQNVISK